MKLRYLQMMIAAAALSGCAVTSFAPPPVPLNHKLKSSASDLCLFEKISPHEEIVPGVLGALVLVDNYRRVYSCAASEAADGRQIFQVPSLLAAVMAGVGPSFGLDNDGSIAALTGAAVLDRANAYYSPKEKSEMLTAARDAVNCVGGAAVGMDFFDTRVRETQEGVESAIVRAETLSANLSNRITDLNDKLGRLETQRTNLGAQTRTVRSQDAQVSTTSVDIVAQAERLEIEQASLAEQLSQLRRESLALRNEVETAKAGIARGGRGLILRTQTDEGEFVEIDVNRVFFERVKVALDAIDTALADRLRGSGAYDRASLIKDIQDLAKEEEEIEAEAEEDEEQDETAVQEIMGMAGVTDQQKLAARQAVQQRQAVRNVKVDLDALKPRLDTCVARAKIK